MTSLLPTRTLLLLLLSLLSPLLTHASFPHPPPAHLSPRQTTPSAPIPQTFQIVGSSGVSAQMMFLGTPTKLYILDKTENNPLTITSATTGKTHAAWGTEYDLVSNTYRAMDVESNTFCAGGYVLGNGTWAVFGGNQPVTTGGAAATTASNAYASTDGGTAIRLLNPDSTGTAQYIQAYNNPSVTSLTTGSTALSSTSGGWLQMTSRRWYPMVEGLADGSVIIIGGDKNGGYVNTAIQDNPTYEFFPARAGGAQTLQFLSDTLPVNLYALTWLLPSGNLFMQANRSTILYDYNTKTVTNLPSMPHAVRVYPASAATVMLPLTPDNGYTATLLFCGGSNPPNGQWGDDGGPRYNVTAVAADNSCVRITPDNENPQYEEDDYLAIGRSMGTFVYLPDGTLWMGNGVAMGTAGYGDSGQYSVGQSFGQAPIYAPAIYDPLAASGQKWTTGLAASTEERMYHSTVMMVPDGSLIISGSNPNADYTTAQWGTKYSVERWYPKWYNSVRPGTAGFPKSLSYGGSYWTVQLNTTDQAVVESARVNVIRGGFSTHAIQMGQRFLQLNTSYTINTSTNKTTLYVSQMPPNANIFQPGPAMLFLVLDGVPSIGQFIMVGNGILGTQPISAVTALPPPSVYVAPPSTASASSTGTAASSGPSGTVRTVSASKRRIPSASSLGGMGLVGLAMGMMVMA